MGFPYPEDENGRLPALSAESAGACAADEDLDSIEIALLLEGIFRHYGFDFSNYNYASLRQRIENLLPSEKVRSISGLQEKVLHNPDCLDRFLLATTVKETTMFRDPTFYLALRQEVIPILRTYPSVQIWEVGCSTGEEVYSLVILLKEEGIFDKCRIYATDMNPTVLKKAREGVYSASRLKQFLANYTKAGGKASLSDYFVKKGDKLILDQRLRRNLLFAEHNLVTDRSFNEFQLIICRDFLSYFNRAMQEQAFDLFHNSLELFGLLCLGHKESLAVHPYRDAYQEIVPRQRIFKRVT